LAWREAGRKASRALTSVPHDIVFGFGSDVIAGVECRAPIVMWSDATWAAMVGYYPEYDGLCARSLRDGHAQSLAALGRSSLALFASEWAARSAVSDYGIDPANAHVVPMGANIEPTEAEAARMDHIIASRPADRCRLLAIGVDWQRKGVDIAVEARAAVERAGLPCELTVVGCTPPPGRSVPKGVRVMGYVSQAHETGRRVLADLLSASHFHVLPSRAEAFGIAFAEASAFGVPSLGARTGGVPTTVREGRNGHLLPLEARGDDYAQVILSTMERAGDYRELARSSFAEYVQRLNWRTANARMLELAAGVIQG
jgi:glycosyltransferase involved in cell wall biosynthesis